MTNGVQIEESEETRAVNVESMPDFNTKHRKSRDQDAAFLDAEYNDPETYCLYADMRFPD